MDLGLRDKTVVVTGGSGGIGSAIATTMAAEGANVVVTYFRNAAGGQAVASELRGIGVRAMAAQLDVRDSASIRAVFDETERDLGSLDILINCAGIARFSALTNFADGAFQEVLDTNVKGVFTCSREAVRHFRAAGQGDIVNVSSLAAVTGLFEGGPYAAAKAAVNSLTLSLALELASDNIRVNAVAPGRIATRFRRASSGKYFDFMLDQTPMKRLGTPQEVASAVAFMASRACPFITGETLFVTGGLHAVYLEPVSPEPDARLGG